MSVHNGNDSEHLERRSKAKELYFELLLNVPSFLAQVIIERTS